MDVLNDWSAYREILFDKLYVPYLKDFTNQLYMHRDFFANQYGKRLISNMQWHTFYNFLPHLKFEHQKCVLCLYELHIFYLSYDV